jgi:tetraacyldisaccharide 4'-kinase
MNSVDRGRWAVGREEENPVLLKAGRALEWVNLAARGLYTSGVLRTHRAAAPVVSVGNIALGGTGKTPLVAAIARFLHEHGARPAVLTRGYRRRDARPRLVVNEPGVAWQEVGDEPTLLARLLPDVPIVVDADRVRGAATALRETAATHLVLDDGFQHWRVARNLDIVTVDAEDPLCTRRLRREGPGALARAEVAVAINASREALAAARPLLCAHAPGLRLVDCRLRASAVILGGEQMPIAWVQGRRVLAFAGIAAPWRFFDTLESLGADVVEASSFPDHHVCSADEIVALARRAGELDAIPIATAKDAVKLAAADLERVAWLAVELEPPTGVLADLLQSLLGERK